MIPLVTLLVLDPRTYCPDKAFFAGSELLRFTGLRRTRIRIEEPVGVRHSLARNVAVGTVVLTAEERLGRDDAVSSRNHRGNALRRYASRIRRRPVRNMPRYPPRP